MCKHVGGWLYIYLNMFVPVSNHGQIRTQWDRNMFWPCSFHFSHYMVCSVLFKSSSLPLGYLWLSECLGNSQMTASGGGCSCHVAQTRNIVLSDGSSKDSSVYEVFSSRILIMIWLLRSLIQEDIIQVLKKSSEVVLSKMWYSFFIQGCVTWSTTPKNNSRSFSLCLWKFHSSIYSSLGQNCVLLLCCKTKWLGQQFSK
jgi:hypothetical protein